MATERQDLQDHRIQQLQEGMISVQGAVIRMQQDITDIKDWSVRVDIRLEALNKRFDDLEQLIRDSHSQNGT